MRPNAAERVERKQEAQKRNHDMTAKRRSFTEGDDVYVKVYKKGGAWEWAPGCIAKCTGPLSFVVQLKDGRYCRRLVGACAVIALIVLFKLSARCNNHSIILIWIPVYSQTLQWRRGCNANPLCFARRGYQCRRCSELCLSLWKEWRNGLST